ncbi:hypothetical protein BV20DRAFT_707771 [Pilatotrama ljubarskyi]|nr:hypothetical protein BV20DRAFT_707771 [Pilatotrama ljubarskyi]
MTSYLDALSALLPDDSRHQLDHALVPQVRSLVDAIIRLAVGASAPEDSTVPNWEELQARAAKVVDELKRGEHGRSQKRPREGEPLSPSKRARTDSAAAAPSVEQDPPVFTLHALSVSSPIRKKVNITIHRSSIRLTNPSTQKEEHPPIPLADLQRAFLLSTRGKSKPHWTVALLSSDIPTLTGKAAEAANETPIPQLVFGLDANLTAPFTTCTYDDDGSSTVETYPKGSASLPALRAFLSHIPTATLEPSTSIFRSAAAPSGGDGVAGVEAYRGAKQGTLWFLHEGVLWDGKPCEFFALEHLASAGKSEQAYEGVRTLSATGRTCSVILRRRTQKSANGKGGADQAGGNGQDGQDEEEGEDIDFGMVDGREQETIARWIKSHRHLFGRPHGSESGQHGTQAADAKGKGKAKATEAELMSTKADDPRNEETEDEEDSDFTMDSSDDSDESSSDEEDDSGSDAGAKEGEGDEDEDEDEDGEGNASDDVTGDEAEEEEAELDPKHHSLLRPGAMPRMSRAAVEAVVGMVEQDLMGGGRRGGQGEDSEEDEEDELED